MQFRFQKNDGMAQQGKLITNHDSISTPQIIYLSSESLNIPSYATLVLKDNTTDLYHPLQLISSTTKNIQEKDQIQFSIQSPRFFPSILPKNIHNIIEKSSPLSDNNVYVTTGHLPENMTSKSKDIQLVIISHAYQLFLDPKVFSTYLHTLRSKIPPDTLIYIPAIANPQNLSTLIFLGVDLVDSSQSILAARANILFFPEGNKSLTTFETVPCHCPVCTHLGQKPTDYTFDDIFQHNNYIFSQELNLIHHAIKTESLREHILTRISNSPHLTSIIRQAEYDPVGILEQKTPRYRQSILRATNIDACYQPEVKRFQHTTINTYRKPDHTSILLLLPCSAKKPYSFSKTHKRFHRTIQQIPNHQCIHELIITSPLGIVPRELELMYPASSYDIPVTHKWFDDELNMITSLLEKYLTHNQYQSIICYLPTQLQSTLKSNFPEFTTPTISTSPSTQSDLDSLKDILIDLTKDQKPVSTSQRRKDDMFCRAATQFNPSIAKTLMKDTQIKGKYPYLKIIDATNTQLGMLTEKRGLISLTIQGGERISSHKNFTVFLSDDFTIKGSIFAPGIIDADPMIRKGDEVIIFQKNRFQSVGVALMNGEEMLKRKSGKAVDIRHHR